MKLIAERSIPDISRCISPNLNLLASEGFSAASFYLKILTVRQKPIELFLADNFSTFLFFLFFFFIAAGQFNQIWQTEGKKILWDKKRYYIPKKFIRLDSWVKETFVNLFWEKLKYEHIFILGTSESTKRVHSEKRGRLCVTGNQASFLPMRKDRLFLSPALKHLPTIHKVT